MLFGANQGSFDRMAALTNGLTAIRMYRKDWTPMVPNEFKPGVVPIISVNELDLAAVASGTKDVTISAWIDSVPMGSLITFGHELNGSSFHVTPATFNAALDRLAMLADHAGFGHSVGAVFTMWPIVHQGQDISPWLSDTARWYGLDGYAGANAVSADQTFVKCIKAIRAASGGNIMITETNSENAQDAWLDAVLSVAEDYVLQGLLWFANGTPAFPNLPSSLMASKVARVCALNGGHISL